MEEKISAIKQWLGAGSINIFGLPMSGKDTVGRRLAKTLDAEFLSSGQMIRAVEETTGEYFTDDGSLAPTDLFFDVILPCLQKPEFEHKPLILSSVGRWSGEENKVMEVAKAANHEIKAVLMLEISPKEAVVRRQLAKELDDRGKRLDDRSAAIFDKRLAEFNIKTLPVIAHYEQLSKLIRINAEQERDAVFTAVINQIYEFSKN